MERRHLDIFSPDVTNESVIRLHYTQNHNQIPNTLVKEFTIEIEEDKVDEVLNIIDKLSFNNTLQLVATHTYDKQGYSIRIFELYDKIYLSFDITTDKIRLEILYSKKTEFIDALLKECNEAFKPYEFREKTKIGFNLFMNNGGPYLHFNEIPDKYLISIEDNYNDNFQEENKLIINSLKEGGTSLCLFHGDPGCGKTHYIRYLIAELCKEKKKVIYFPNEHIHFLSDPSFLHFFKDHKKSIIVIEDAEEILTSRELTLSNRGISNLLNLTDGLMGDFLELKFVCTFNTAIDKIDKALLRKGRITTNYKFEKLSVEKANKLLEKLGKNHTTTEAMTLAEIYNLEQKDNSEKKERKIGFGAN
jgi:DNA polymerase III delta prime subunit